MNLQNGYRRMYRAHHNLWYPVARQIRDAYRGFVDTLGSVLRPENMLSTAAATLVFLGSIANVSSAKDVGSIRSGYSGGIITNPYPGSAYRLMLKHKNKKPRALPPADIPDELEERRISALKERPGRYKTPAINPYPKGDMRQLAAELMLGDARLSSFIPNELEERRISALKERPGRYKTPAIKPRAKELYKKVQPPKKHVFAAYDPVEGTLNDGEWVFVSKDLAKRLKKGLYRAAPEEAWSLRSDLRKYRLYAVKEGSRDSAESLGKAFSNAGLAIEDGINIFAIGYASERGLPFRGNDGKSPFFHLGKVVDGGGKTIEDILLLLYAGADAAVLDSLPDPENEAYKDNHPLVRLPVHAGMAIGDAWKTVENAGNTLTWGYWDNVTGSAGRCFVDIVEIGKHGGEAVTNLPRGPVRLIFGENKYLEGIQDWVFLVPLECSSNIIEMEGIRNMGDYKIAFGEKGVIGSAAEMVGSGFIVGKSAYKLID